MENPEKKGRMICGYPYSRNPPHRKPSKDPNSKKKNHCPGQVAGQPLWKDPSVPSPGTQVAGKFMEDFSDGKPETKMFIMSGWDYIPKIWEN